MKTKLNMEERPLSDLHPAEYNPRVALAPEDEEYKRIKRSIETYGYVDPIIINSDGTIIGGHQRYNVLLDLGYDTAHVVIVDLDKNAEKALNVALNKISGEWDDEKLCDLLQDLDLSGYDFSLTGFTRSELDGLQLKLGVGEAVEDEDFDVDKAVEECEKPVTKRGDLWIMGGHRLLCGDARNVDDMARLMGGAKADLLLTDPPYNVDYVGKTKDALKIDNDRMSNADFRAFLLEAFTAARQSMKAGAAFYIWHADSNGYDFRGACMDAGWKVRQCLIWEKDILVLGRQDYQWQHEPCLYGWNEGAGHAWYSDRKQTTILRFDKPTRSKEHPTMKPVPLFGYLVQNSSKPGDIVLDPFSGSGTTVIAAEQLDRTAYVMELNERYCDVIVKRWEEQTGEKAVLDGGLRK
ncbi:MAG: DNA modification methylase [Eubacterium sp.]|jgi:DNA modification methylase|nr:DNA modification methylase [Eubacterium sp.]